MVLRDASASKNIFEVPEWTLIKSMQIRSNMAGNLLPWDGDDWEMSSEILEEEYEVWYTFADM